MCWVPRLRAALEHRAVGERRRAPETGPLQRALVPIHTADSPSQAAATRPWPTSVQGSWERAILRDQKVVMTDRVCRSLKDKIHLDMFTGG